MLSLVGRHRFRSHGNFNEAKFSNEIKHDDHRTTTKKLCRNEIKLYVYTVYVHVQPCVVQWQYRNESRIFSSFPHFLGFHLEKKRIIKRTKSKVVLCWALPFGSVVGKRIVMSCSTSAHMEIRRLTKMGTMHFLWERSEKKEQHKINYEYIAQTTLQKNRQSNVEWKKWLFCRTVPA